MWRPDLASRVGCRLRLGFSIALALVSLRAAGAELLAVEPLAEAPRSVTNLREIRVRLARGEYEPASFLVRTKARLDDVEVDIRGDAASFSPDVFVVKEWYQAAKAWDAYHQAGPNRRLVPELLLKDAGLVRADHNLRDNWLRLGAGDAARYVRASTLGMARGRDNPSTSSFPIRDADSFQPVDIEAGGTQQFWITFRAPHGKTAGIYRGSVAVTAGGEDVAAIPIVVELLPIELGSPDLTYSIYYRGVLDPKRPTTSSEGKSLEQMRLELADMREHGIDNPTVYQPWPKGTDTPAQRSERLALVERVLQLRSELGLAGRPVYFVGTQTGNMQDERGLQQLRDKTKQLAKLVRSYGGTDVYMYAADEARGAALTSQRQAWQTVRSADGRVMAAGYKEQWGLMGGLTDLLIYHGRPDRLEAAKQHGHGNEIFSYHNPQAGPENPALFRNNYGVRLWQENFDGSMIYAYQDSMGSIWNDFDHYKWRDCALTYPTTDRPISTVAWEGLREAVDDVRYLSTLRRLAEKARSSNIPGPLAERSTRYLEDLGNRPTTTGARVRDEVIPQIIELARALETHSQANQGE